MAQKFTASEIAVKLKTDDRWLLRGLKAIYERQTEDEQNTDHTNHSNNVGFNAADARKLSPIARHAIEKGWISPRDRHEARTRMLKYSGQLARIANAKAEKGAAA